MLDFFYSLLCIASYIIVTDVSPRWKTFFSFSLVLLGNNPFFFKFACFVKRGHFHFERLLEK